MAGSSPLTRGKPGCPPRWTRQSGLIPAHAGKTTDRGGRALACGAHPRSRGENRAARRASCAHDGSSPLTRGKPPGSHHDRRHHGLIPAHAGKTFARFAVATDTPAHPRSRGENLHRSGPLAAVEGSSPLTRGKPSTSREDDSPLGLIPAHAGKTSRTRQYPRRGRAHPRSRGENVVAAISAAGVAGSSPLTRGKRGVCKRKR